MPADGGCGTRQRDICCPGHTCRETVRAAGPLLGDGTAAAAAGLHSHSPYTTPTNSIPPLEWPQLRRWKNIEGKWEKGSILQQRDYGYHNRPQAQ